MDRSAPTRAALFSPEQLATLVEASRRTRKIRRCIAVAMVSGWTTAIFGALSLLGLAFSFSFASLFVAAALLAVAWGEFHGAAMVRRFEPAGARRLAVNQVFFGAALLTYSVWCLVDGLRGGALVASGNPEVDEMMAGITRMATVAMYGTLAVVGALGPGLTAWYYASREKLIRQFRDKTEAGVVEALKVA
jgi:hypothetical protein